MKNTKLESGIAIIEIIIILLVIGVGAAVGILGMNAWNAKYNTQESSVATNVPDAPSISNTSDLNSANSVIDSINLDSQDADISTLDSQLSAF